MVCYSRHNYIFHIFNTNSVIFFLTTTQCTLAILTNTILLNFLRRILQTKFFPVTFSTCLILPVPSNNTHHVCIGLVLSTREHKLPLFDKGEFFALVHELAPYRHGDS